MNVETAMLNTVEAVLSSDGALRFLEPVKLDRSQRVLVTFTETQDETSSGALLSEQALAVDWLDPDEDAAWAHLQAPQQPGATGG
jgi:hypothetical protein